MANRSIELHFVINLHRGTSTRCNGRIDHLQEALGCTYNFSYIFWVGCCGEQTATYYVRRQGSLPSSFGYRVKLHHGQLLAFVWVCHWNGVPDRHRPCWDRVAALARLTFALSGHILGWIWWTPRLVPSKKMQPSAAMGAQRDDNDSIRLPLACSWPHVQLWACFRQLMSVTFFFWPRNSDKLTLEPFLLASD